MLALQACVHSTTLAYPHSVFPINEEFPCKFMAYSIFHQYPKMRDEVYY
jgi:hypothetical protein